MNLAVTSESTLVSRIHPLYSIALQGERVGTFAKLSHSDGNAINRVTA